MVFYRIGADVFNVMVEFLRVADSPIQEPGLPSGFNFGMAVKFAEKIPLHGPHHRFNNCGFPWVNQAMPMVREHYQRREAERVKRLNLPK